MAKEKKWYYTGEEGVEKGKQVDDEAKKET